MPKPEVVHWQTDRVAQGVSIDTVHTGLHESEEGRVEIAVVSLAAKGGFLAKAELEA